MDSFLENGLKSQKDYSMYMSGAPGTGKTLLIHHIISEICSLRQEK